ncbi:MAG: hypothetical protein IPK83_22390 [Planctomycetes bacterium]|nr:hypothetical protein [Planctomycetota bacterium]
MAKFADGEVLVVVNTRQPAKSEEDGKRRIADAVEKERGVGVELDDRSALIRLPGEAGQTVRPESKKVLLVNAMGTYYTDDTPKLKEWFTAAGYEPELSDGSVESFRNDVKGIGVLYVNSHGALIPWDYISTENQEILMSVAETPAPNHLYLEDEKGRNHFIIWTRTVVNNESVEKYRDEVKSGRLAYIYGQNNGVPGGSQTYGRHFGITELFVLENWKCEPNALMYMDCCWSAKGAIRDVCLSPEVNATTYIGWDSTSFDGTTSSSVLYFFDRVLGRNDYLPPAIKQRPFSVLTVEEAMRGLTRRQLGMDPILNGDVDLDLPLIKSGKSGQTAELVFYVRSPILDEFLLPGILNVKVGNKVLTLDGSFGDTPGTVTIDGTPLSVREWTTGRIECDVAEGGPGYSGKVMVETDGLKSNPRALSQWNLTLNRLFMDFPTQLSTNCPACFYEATIHYSFSADVGGTRQRPDEAVTASNYTGSAFEGDIEVTNAGGSYFIGQGSTITLLPNADDGAELIGTCVGFLPPEDNNYLGACYFVNGQTSSIAFSPTLFAQGLIRNYTGGAYDGIVEPYGVLYFGNLIGNELVLSLSPNFTIEAGHQDTGDNSYFEWESADAVSAPGVDDPR